MELKDELTKLYNKLAASQQDLEPRITKMVDEHLVVGCPAKSARPWVRTPTPKPKPPASGTPARYGYR